MENKKCIRCQRLLPCEQDEDTNLIYYPCCPCGVNERQKCGFVARGKRNKPCGAAAFQVVETADQSTDDTYRCFDHKFGFGPEEPLADVEPEISGRLVVVTPAPSECVCSACGDVHSVKKRELFMLHARGTQLAVHRTACPKCGSGLLKYQ